MHTYVYIYMHVYIYACILLMETKQRRNPLSHTFLSSFLFNIYTLTLTYTLHALIYSHSQKTAS